MSALEDRRQRAREAWHDEYETPGTVPDRGARAVEVAIETATRVRVTPEVNAAFRSAAAGGGHISDTGVRAGLVAAFRMAGFEVQE